MTTVYEDLDASPVEKESEQARHHRLRWIVLGVLALAQLMVVLDATIVNIALPHAQESLGFGDADRQWIITAYALSFGSLLLLGGRLSDLWGRKTTFIIGLIGFAVMSAVGGAAVNFEMLVAARAGQGVFGALLAPAALSLLTTTFTDPAERGKAFGIFGAIAGGGGALGLLLGGMLTEWADWRWCLYVNLVIAAIALVGAVLFLGSHKSEHHPKLDLPGVVTASAGLFSIVYGFSNAETNGWADWATITWLVAGVVLVAGFIWWQSRSKHALLPLRVIKDRTRGGSYLVVFIAGIGMFGIFLFLTYYLQQNLGFSPIRTGLAFLPMIGMLVITATTSTAVILPRFGPRWLMSGGMLIAAVGMVLLTQITVTSSYATHVLPALLILGVGIGASMAPAMQGAISGVSPEDAGVASATVNTMQQVGGSVGTALLSTIASSAAASYVTDHAATVSNQNQLAQMAAVDSYTTAFAVAAGVFVIGGLIAGLLVRSGKLPSAAPSDAGSPEAGPSIEGETDSPAVRPRIAGSVVNGNDTPLDTAAITVTDIHGRQVGTTAVHGDGFYTVHDIADGTYTVIATAPGHAPKAMTVSVVGDTVSHRDFTLAGGAVLRGRVRDGHRALGAKLIVTDQSGAVVTQAHADADGHFAITGLSTGDTVAVTASAPGYQPASQLVTIDAAAGRNVEPVEILLAPTSGVEGAVRAAHSGSPLHGATVSAIGPDQTIVASATTDADGRYRIDGLTDGRFTIVANLYEPAAIQVEVVAGQHNTADIGLASGKNPAVP